MNEKDVKEIFKKHELDGYSRWDIGGGIQYILPELKLNENLRIIKIEDDNLTGIDFRLVLSNGLIVFHEILSGRLFGLDIDDIVQDKIYFRGADGEINAVWTRLSIESIDDLLSSFP